MIDKAEQADLPERRPWLRSLAWLGLAGGLVWQGFVFAKYNSGPFPTFWEAAFDSLPLVLIVAAIVTLARTRTRSDEDKEIRA